MKNRKELLESHGNGQPGMGTVSVLFFTKQADAVRYLESELL